MTDDEIRKLVTRYANDESLARIRHGLARETANIFDLVGKELNVLTMYSVGETNSHMINVRGQTIAVALLFRIAGQLTSAANDLFKDGRHYAAASLLRQLVEIEYLAWAFESNNEDATKWINSDKSERETFFSPRKLREAAKGRFRSKDYGYHCELGGHPVPNATVTLFDNEHAAQLLLSDLLGHTGRIWDHFLEWASNKQEGSPIVNRKEQMFYMYRDWKANDPLTQLPPP